MVGPVRDERTSADLRSTSSFRHGSTERIKPRRLTIKRTAHLRLAAR
jgi:hypothetical protein